MTSDDDEIDRAVKLADEIREMVLIGEHGVTDVIVKALAYERTKAVKETLEVVIQVLNDYPDITVDDLARIKNEIYEEFPDFDKLNNECAGQEEGK